MESRESREQLRCCNWIQRPNFPEGESANPGASGGEGGAKEKPGVRTLVRRALMRTAGRPDDKTFIA